MKIIRVDFTVEDEVDHEKFGLYIEKIYPGEADDEEIEYVIGSIRSTRTEGERK